MKKRLLSLFMSLAMVFTMMPAVHVHAEGKAIVTISASTEEIVPDDVVTVSVSVAGIEKLSTITADLSIPDGLEYVEGSMKMSNSLAQSGYLDFSDYGVPWFNEDILRVGLSWINPFNVAENVGPEFPLFSFDCKAKEAGDNEVSVDEDIEFGIYNDDDGTTDTYPVEIIFASIHIHELSEDTWTEGTDATCQKEATVGHYACSCGSYFNKSGEELDGIATGEKADHNFSRELVDSKYLASEATCTSVAKYYKSCFVCGEKGIETFGDPNGVKADHNFNQEVAEAAYLKSAASCTEAAVYYKSCVCGKKGSESETFTFGSTIAHDFSKESAESKYLKSAADCTDAAVYYKSCVCGAKGTETFTHGSANGHSMTATPAKEATCTATGNKAYWTCRTCHKVYADVNGTTETTVEESTLPKEEHTPVWNKDNTHHWQECFVETCKAVIEGTKKEHTYPDTWTNNSAAGHSKTCTEGNCEYMLIEVHTYDQENTDIKYQAGNADCQTPASYFYSCVCGEKGSDTFKTKTGNHQVEYVEAEPHTCTKDGVIAHWKCTVTDCGKYFEDEAATKELTNIVDAAPGHNYVTVPHENHVKVEATCTSAAVYKTYCSVCGDENGETFNGTEMKPHDTTPTAAVAETCTTAGNHAYWTCSTCLQIFKNSLGTETFENLEATIIPKTGHKMTETPVKAATCTEDGTQGYFTCYSCKGVYTDEAGTTPTTVDARKINKLGHDFDSEASKDATKAPLKTAATCKAPAEYWRICARENCTVVSNENYFTYGEVAPHTAENTKKTAAKAETCTEDGIVAHWDCTHCGKIFADNNGAPDTDNVITEAATVKPAHGHTEATSWSTDDDSHWKVCACENGCENGCGVMIEGSEAAHTWVKQESSTETRTDFKCPTCEATKSEYVTNEEETSSSVQAGSAATITVAVGENATVSKVLVNGNEVDSSNYSVAIVDVKDESDNVVGHKAVVTLSASYLQSQGAGSYTVDVVFNENGKEVKATSSLTVTAAPTSTPSTPSVDYDYDYDEEEEEDGKVSSSEVKEAFEDAKKDKVTIDLESEELISKRVFTELMKDTDMTVVIRGDGYSWTFKGSDIDENIKSAYFDARVTGSTSKLKAIKKLTGNAKIQIVHTDHNGALPGMATLTVTVDKAMRSKPINVYYYNPETKSLEPIASGLTVKNNKVSFSLDHCSDYILTNHSFGTVGTVADKVNPETGAADLSAAAFAAVAMAGCAVVAFKKNNSLQS